VFTVKTIVQERELKEQPAATASRSAPPALQSTNKVVRNAATQFPAGISGLVDELERSRRTPASPSPSSRPHEEEHGRL